MTLIVLVGMAMIMPVGVPMGLVVRRVRGRAMGHAALWPGETAPCHPFDGPARRLRWVV